MIYKNYPFLILVGFIVFINQKESSYALQIDPSKEILSRTKKQKSTFSVQKDTAAKITPKPQFLGGAINTLPKLTEKLKNSSETNAEPSPLETVQITNKQKKSKQPFLDNSTNIKLAVNDQIIHYSREKSNIETKKNIEADEYNLYIDLIKLFKEKFQVSEFNVNENNAKINKKKYKQTKKFIENFLTLIIHSEHYSDLMNILNQDSLNENDLKKITIINEYIKFILSLTKKYIPSQTFLYQPTLLKFPQLYKNLKTLSSSLQFEKCKGFKLNTIQYDLFIKKSSELKIHISQQMIQKIQSSINSSHALDYINNNLGIITHALLLPFKSDTYTIKYLISLVAVEFDKNFKVKNVYEIHLLPSQSYNFNIVELRNYTMLQHIAEKLQTNILKIKPNHGVDSTLLKFIQTFKDESSPDHSEEK